MLKMIFLLALVSFATALEQPTSLFSTRLFDQYSSSIQQCNFQSRKIICNSNERCASALRSFLMIKQEELDNKISEFNKPIPGQSRAFYYFSQSDYNLVGWIARSDLVEEAQKAVAAKSYLISNIQALIKAIDFYMFITKSMAVDSTDFLSPSNLIIFRGMTMSLEYRENGTYMATGYQSFTKDISVSINFMGKTPNSPKSIIQVMAGQTYVKGRDMNAHKDSYFATEQEFVLAPAFLKILKKIKVAYSKISEYNPVNPRDIYSTSANDSYVDIFLVEILNPLLVRKVDDCM